MVLLSSAQRYWRMPRFLSAVTILSSSLPTVLTHTCRTFFLSGASQASRWPSGERRGCDLSGLPNRTSRGITGGRSAERAAGRAANAAAATTSPRTKRFIM